MLRRSFLHRFGGKPTLLLLDSNNLANEIAREKELRSKVMRGVSTPKFDHSVYASYESSPGQFNSGTGGASTSAPPPPSANAFFPSFSDFMNTRVGGGSGGGNSGNQKPKAGLSDYFAFATGLILIAYSIKILTRGAGPGADGSIIPMWAITPMLKAKYILFTVITTDAERESLKAEFNQIQATMPFLTFFDWLDQRYPNWGAGRRYSQDHVVGVIAQAIGPNSGATAIARLVAEVMQKKTGGLLGLGSKPAGDRLQLVDDMVETIQPTIASNQQHAPPTGFGAFGGQQAQPPAFYPNVNPQWGMQQQQQQQYATQPQFGQQSSQHHNQYYQQPNATELTGTQEINISDITGGEPIPQHHYESKKQNTDGHQQTAPSQGKATPSQSQKDPLSRTA